MPIKSEAMRGDAQKNSGSVSSMRTNVLIYTAISALLASAVGSMAYADDAASAATNNGRELLYSAPIEQVDHAGESVTVLGQTFHTTADQLSVGQVVNVYGVLNKDGSVVEPDVEATDAYGTSGDPVYVKGVVTDTNAALARVTVNGLTADYTSALSDSDFAAPSVGDVVEFEGNEPAAKGVLVVTATGSDAYTAATSGGVRVAVMMGTGARTANITGGGDRVANITGGGSRTSNITGGGSRTANITGGGFQVANITGGGSRTSNITGGGSRTANITGGGFQVANITGGGSRTSNITGGGSKTANITGGGDRVANITGGGSRTSNITGGGSKTANITGGGSRAANITGGGLKVAVMMGTGNSSR